MALRHIELTRYQRVGKSLAIVEAEGQRIPQGQPVEEFLAGVHSGFIDADEIEKFLLALFGTFDEAG